MWSDFSLKKTDWLLYSIFGLRVPDDGTVIFYREIKLKMGFGVVSLLLLVITMNTYSISDGNAGYVKARGIKYI